MPEQQSLSAILVEETGLQAAAVRETVSLLEDGASVPFIARYRKEMTGGLDEVQIRLIQERLQYFKELDERRQTILKSIDEQGKLTPELKNRLLSCRQKTDLEDLYLPYRPKRRTKATIAREQGLEPLAQQILMATTEAQALELLAEPFVAADQGILDSASALMGAGHIAAEGFADDARARAIVREQVWQHGKICSRLLRGKDPAVSKYEMYYDYSEAVKSIPSHRMLAMRRGEREEVLTLYFEVPEDQILTLLQGLLIPADHPYRSWLEDVVADAYRRLILPSIEVELRLRAKKLADAKAIRVFAENLRNLLLAPPLGSRRVLGVDPGLRTGSKLAVVDETGRFLEHVTIYPHKGRGLVEPAAEELVRLIRAHNIEMIAIGNGTAGREMDQFVRQTLKKQGLNCSVMMVSEAGASIYSASAIAREEFPELDLTVRGAISIARRLQDPLAELVKVEAKSIGVGQYQHDVSQSELKKALDNEVESCVNFVGVDLNTASWALLSYVSGISESLAKAIVSQRDANGGFRSRRQLLDVPRFGPKAFEQAAGFLRIRHAEHPLDNSAVHPERYALVEQMADDLDVTIEKLCSDAALLDQLELRRYLSDSVGLPTLQDILQELKKPGRDPRENFVSTNFREDVMELSDLREGMVLNGIVTNVAAFGAFVDIGVHQDGLVHISQLADRFVKDPNQVVKVGQSVQVRVLSVDGERRRIGLSMRIATAESAEKPPTKTARTTPIKTDKQAQPAETDLAAALKRSGFTLSK
ncbi:MAG: RNA-binding transcriptional accessory protein [Desulfuromonadales bacterium]|nr:RNA-binding transcriptional accessory protein [Desulfuromonadales bacterium]MBN2792174.1 RNA-binding transcriptional accessory protein [Desulfuromonadales bacterium]